MDGILPGEWVGGKGTVTIVPMLRVGRTLRVLLTTQSVENCIPTLEREERSSQLSCDALRRMPFRAIRVLFATQSVETCIPTLEREERSSQLSCDALRCMPFRTLRVLLTTQSVEHCIPTLERAER